MLPKIVKFLSAIGLTFCLILPSITIFAEDTQNNITDEKLILIEEKEYYDEENGLMTTEKLYVSQNALTKGASGSGTFKKEKSMSFAARDLVYYVQGYFSWNEDANTATVSNVTSGITSTPGNLTFSNHSTTSGSNKGGIPPGKRYAYAQYEFTARNQIGISWNLKAYVDVNVLGQSSSH